MFIPKEISSEAQSVLKIKSFQEIPFAEADAGPKLTKGSFVIGYTGDLEGEGILEEQKVHFTTKRAEIYGTQRFTGRLLDRAGSFVLTHRGRFMNGLVIVKMTVVPGSATAGLKGLRGEIRLRSGQAEVFPVTFHYYFA